MPIASLPLSTFSPYGLKRLPLIEFDGMPNGGDHGKQNHSGSAEGTANIEQLEVVPEQVSVWMEIQGEGTDDEQNAQLGRPEHTVRHMKTFHAIGRQVGFDGQDQEPDQHGQGYLPVNVTGCSESHHKEGRAECIHYVVDVKTVAGPLLLTHASDRSVQAVAQPIQHDEKDHPNQG